MNLLHDDHHSNSSPVSTIGILPEYCTRCTALRLLRSEFLHPFGKDQGLSLAFNSPMKRMQTSSIQFACLHGQGCKVELESNHLATADTDADFEALDEASTHLAVESPRPAELVEL